eukprot:CAMPEP_0178400742 /NCGR_PEP_ID=MMETSP0689_2-20121128/15945_1 /TAXON_ID=160604 /ORGANISM="Amphidinium massartii, Strain CS-259" /LENGTH=235 /DNA_ID=CAMNT_0020021545 /DNA_START=110 /DNA_END=814 /DNA_ORIENTATION=-
MKIYVQFKEGEDEGQHWRQQVTLPKKWLQLPCERLKLFVMENYNKARRTPDTALQSQDWHLCNETDDWRESLGSENLISEVVGEYDNIYLRPGVGTDLTHWRREQAQAAPQAITPVIMRVEFAELQRLRKAVEEDDEGSFKHMVEEIGVSSPDELLIAETDVRDESGERIIGTEWHAIAGRYGWEIDGDYGQDTTKRMSVKEFARRCRAESVLRLIALAERKGVPIVSCERERSL